jgi:hypothetical protein
LDLENEVDAANPSNNGDETCPLYDSVLRTNRSAMHIALRLGP